MGHTERTRGTYHGKYCYCQRGGYVQSFLIYHFDVVYQENEWTEQVSRDAEFIAQKLYNVAENSIQKCYDQHGMCPSVAINAHPAFYAYIALQKFKCEGDKCDIESELASEIAKCAERPIVMSAWESKGMKAALQAFVYGIAWGGIICSWKVYRGKMNLSKTQ